MSWQTETFERLRDREWHCIGDLFEAVEAQIPLHRAMRVAMQPSYGRTELPGNTEARWVCFTHHLSVMGIERPDGKPPRRWKWQDQIRLRYVAGRACDRCGGPVIQAGWSSRKRVECLACDRPAAVEAAPVPVVETPIEPVPVVETPPVETVAPPVPVTPPPAAAIAQARDRRALARWIRTWHLQSVSVNLIERLLNQGFTPNGVVQWIRQSFQPRAPPRQKYPILRPRKR